MSKLQIGRRTAAVLFAGLLGVGTFAAAASNTVPTSRAGDGNGAISGYTVSNVQYTLLAADPTQIDLWTFDLNASASVVKSKLVSSSGTYVNCSNTSGNSWQCDSAANPTVAAANQLDVIAHQ